MLALLFPFLLILAGSAADDQTTGMQALDRGDYQQAKEIFAKAVAADPKDYAALFNLAIAEGSLHQDEAAVQHYKQVLLLKPGLYEAELNLGMLQLRDRHLADAVPLLRSAADKKPDQPRTRQYLGDALLQTGDFAGAAEAFQQALKIDPKSALSELGLGQSLQRQGRPVEALQHYQHAAELDPKLRSYLLGEAVALVKGNQTRDAVSLLQQFPEDAGAREELGRIYLESGKAGDAVTEFQAAVNLSPTAANRLALATAYLKNNQPELAQPILEDALRSDPGDYDLRMAVGRIHRDKRDYPAAAAQFVAAARLKGDSAEAWNEAATSFIMAQQYPQALAAFDELHQLGAEKPANYYWRAVVLDKLHQIKPALASYEAFLQTSQGKFPDQEFIARQRSRILEKELRR